MVFIQGTRFTRGGGTNRKGAAGTCCPLPIGPIPIEDGTDSVPKRRHTTIRSRGNTQKNTRMIQNTA